MSVFFDRVVVLNLPSRPERWDRFHKHVEEVGWPFLPYRRFPAVDGSRLPTPPWWTQGKGAWGCLQSHLRVVEQALMDGVRSLLVLEDDVCFAADFPNEVRKFLDEVPPDWDQIYLGGQHLQQRVRPPAPVSPNVCRAHNVNRTHAYALSAKFLPVVYRWLSDYVAHAKSPKHHVDHRLGALHETGKYKVYAPTRWLAGQTLGFSDIRGKDLPARWWNSGGVAAAVPALPFVAVIGLHRSGSSCLAGVLHKLGVHMGDRLIGYERSGGFEAVGLAQICEEAYPFPSTELTVTHQHLEERLARHIDHVRRSAVKHGLKIVGGKYPHLCAMGPSLRHICGDSLRVVHINRPLDASIRSLQSRSRRARGFLKTTDEAADRLQQWLWSRKQEFLAATEHFTIDYEHLLSDPEREIGRLVDYLGITPTDEQRQAAIAHVDPAQEHHRSDRPKAVLSTQNVA